MTYVSVVICALHLLQLSWPLSGRFLLSLPHYDVGIIDSMLPCVCSVIDHRWRQNVIRKKKQRSGTWAAGKCVTGWHTHTAWLFMFGDLGYFRHFFESQKVLFVWFFFPSVSYLYTVSSNFFSTCSLAHSRIIANCESLVSGDTLLTTVLKISCILGRTLAVPVSLFLRLCK